MIAEIHTIRSLDDPGLEPYRTLRRPIEHLEQNIFVAESEKVVLRLLQSAIRPLSLLLSNEWFDKYRTTIEQHPAAMTVFIGEKELLESIVGHRLHQSIMAMARVPKRITVPEMLASAGEKQLFVMVDGITNAENMGVIVRNCVCFNADALIALPSSCDPYLRRSVRNSMGNIFQLPIVYAGDTKSDLALIRSAGITLYAAHPQTGSRPIHETAFDQKSCIVLGAEGNGISPPVLEACDESVTIPMRDGVDSLNVASASAVLLWEISKRQRG